MNRSKVVNGKGPIPAAVMVVGDAPGREDDQYGVPFLGQPGKELTKYLSGVGINRDACYVTLVVKERPAGGKDPKAADIEQWSPVLREEIERVRPRIIAAVGKVSTLWFLGRGVNMEGVHGIPFRRQVIEPTMGTDNMDMVGGYECVVVPCYDPAFGMRDTGNMTLVQADFRAVADALHGRGAAPRTSLAGDVPQGKYSRIRTPEELPEGFWEAREVAIDTEWAKGKPWCLSFAIREGEAFVVKAEDRDVVECVAALVATLDTTTILHNAMYDVNVLRGLGIVPHATLDTMIAAYLLQSEPQGLKPLTYRHVGMEMTAYSDIVGGATRERAIEYLKVAAEFDWPDVSPVVEWLPDGTAKMKQPQNVLGKIRRILSKEGIITPREVAEVTAKYAEEKARLEVEQVNLLDEEEVAVAEAEAKGKAKVKGQGKRLKRLATLSARLERIAELVALATCPNAPGVVEGEDEEEGTTTNPYKSWTNIPLDEGRGLVEKVLGPLEEADLSDIPEEEAIAYAARDADATLRLYPILRAKIEDLGLMDTWVRDMGVVPMVSAMERNGIRIDRAHFVQLEAEFRKEMDRVGMEIDRYGAEVNLPHVNPVSSPQVNALLIRLHVLEPGVNSTSEKELAGVKDKHPVVKLLLDYRKLSKLIGTYAHALPELADDQDRVHSTFRITRTDTGRLSSANPNLQNIPTRTKEGQKIRNGFVARPGWKLVSIDYSQVELRVLAHVSQDPTMLHAYQTGQDIHKITASKMFRVPIEHLDDKKHRYPAKRVNFGIAYGITAKGLLDQFTVEGATGWDEYSCARIIEDWYRVFPRAKEWIEGTKAYARRHGMVRDLFGRIRLVPEVHSAHQRIVDAGLRQAQNAPIQSGAQGIIKQGMGDLVPLSEDFGGLVLPLIQIHDELLFEVHADVVDGFIPMAKAIMENAFALDVPIKCDAEIGERWAEMAAWEPAD